MPIRCLANVDVIICYTRFMMSPLFACHIFVIDDIKMSMLLLRDIATEYCHIRQSLYVMLMPPIMRWAPLRDHASIERYWDALLFIAYVYVTAIDDVGAFRCFIMTRVNCDICLTYASVTLAYAVMAIITVATPSYVVTPLFRYYH